MPKHNIKVALVGEDGNAFAILARVRKAMVKHGVSKEEIAEFSDKAMEGDYDHLLRVVMDYVDVI